MDDVCNALRNAADAACPPIVREEIVRGRSDAETSRRPLWAPRRRGRGLLAAAAVVAVVAGSLAVLTGEDAAKVIGGPADTDLTGDVDTAVVHEATADKQSADLLLDDAAVARVFPELSARTDYSIGEVYGEVRASDVVGGPLQEATGGVVRQWSQEHSRHHDEPVQPAIVNVTSMVLEFPSSAAAQRAESSMFAFVLQQGGEVHPHNTFDTAVSTPDDDHLVTAIGAIAVEDRLITAQINGIATIEPAAITALLDAARERLR